MNSYELLSVYLYKENKRLYYLNSHHSRLVLAVCRMVLLAGRALSCAPCSVYASIWCLEKAGYFYDRLCGYLLSTECGHWRQLRILTIVITSMATAQLWVDCWSDRGSCLKERQNRQCVQTVLITRICWLGLLNTPKLLIMMLQHNW